MRWITEIIAMLTDALPELWPKLIGFLEEGAEAVFVLLKSRIYLWGFGEFLTLWRYWTAVILLAALFCAPVIFVQWKARHLRSYALAEIVGAFGAVLLLLPWDANILDIMSYAATITPARVVALLGAIYFGVRGVENLNKAAMAGP
jgi:hypothetical protein